jgi:hypothetical protein
MQVQALFSALFLNKESLALENALNALVTYH